MNPIILCTADSPRTSPLLLTLTNSLTCILYSEDLILSIVEKKFSCINISLNLRYKYAYEIINVKYTYTSTIYLSVPTIHIYNHDLYIYNIRLIISTRSIDSKNQHRSLIHTVSFVSALPPLPTILDAGDTDCSVTYCINDVIRSGFFLYSLCRLSPKSATP